MIDNYDTEELDKFSKLAAQWWDSDGDLKTLHQVNPLRICFIKNKISAVGKKIIDVGCGGGILSESLAKDGAIVTGIDLNASLIQVGKLHQLESKTNVEYLSIATETIAKDRPKQYDIVTCFELLEHVPNPMAIVSACAALVKPGGHVFFSTLNRNFKAYLFAIIGAEYLLKMLPKHTHDYAKFIRPSELSHWMQQANLKPLDIKGISYSPFTRQFSLSNDVSVNYLLHAIKL